MKQLSFGMTDDIDIEEQRIDVKYPDISIGLAHFEVEIILDALAHYRNTVTIEKHQRWASNENITINGVLEKIKIYRNKQIDMKMNFFNFIQYDGGKITLDQLQQRIINLIGKDKRNVTSKTH